MSFSALWHRCLALVTLAAVLQSYAAQECFGKEPLAAGSGSAAKGSDTQAHSKGGPAEPGWSLRQRSQFDGMFTVSITKKAIRIDGDRLDYRLLLRAPQWRVLIISDRSRKMNEVSPDKWESPFGQTFHALSRIRFENATLVDKGREQFQSVSCRKFEVMPPKDALKRENKKYRGAVVNDAMFLVCDKLGVPVQASTFLCKRFGLPTAPGVPISFVCNNEVGRLETFLTTLRMKKANFPASDFEAPKYKLVKSTKEMMMSSEKMDAIKDLVDGLDSHLER